MGSVFFLNYPDFWLFGYGILSCFNLKCGMWVVNKAIAGIIAMVSGDRSAETFKPLWQIVKGWPCFFYVTDGYVVYPQFIEDADHIVNKTYMTGVEGENTRLRHYLARIQ